jgi:hypothetical protein
MNETATQTTQTLNPDTPAAPVQKQWNDGLDDLVARGLITRMDNWKLADWASWFGGHIADAWTNSTDEVQRAEYQVARMAPRVMEATSSSFRLGYGAEAEEPMSEDVLQLEECQCFLQNHIALLHHRARLERLAPLYWNWVRSMDELTDEQCTAFANEFMVALLEAGSDMMREIFHSKYSRDSLITYMLGEDEAE